MDEQAIKRKRYKNNRRKNDPRYSRRRRRIWIYLAVLSVVCLLGVWAIHRREVKKRALLREVPVVVTETEDLPAGAREVTEMERPPLDVQLLTVNEYSRPGITLEAVNGIVIHYTANPGTSAFDNRNYFENLKTSHTTKASSHFIIGLEGEIVQCIPCSEWAYASNERNGDTISIECCIPDESGKFTDQTYASLVELVSWLCFRYSLDETDLLRHYDITGKNCPKYFVEQPQAWDDFCGDVKAYMEKKANG